MKSTLPFAIVTRVGLDAEAVRDIGIAAGQGVRHRRYGMPVWAVHIQLAQAFSVHPHVFDDYEPAELEMYAAFLSGQSKGEEIRAKQRSKK